jgi:hypothetical protein
MILFPGEGFERLLAVFDRLEIPYMIGGSGASSVYGLVRTTGDLDIVAKIAVADIQSIVSTLREDFYSDEQQMHAALEHSRSFNVIHLRSSYKFDIFPLTTDRYQQIQFGRRRFEKSSIFTGEPLELAVSSPEDVILSKLRLFHQGGEVSEQQWNDVLGVIAVQRQNLDVRYLRDWAEYLGISKLLDQALDEGQAPH